MSRALRFYRSAIGKKAVMGITGLIGVGFVIVHIAGNLLVFSGAAAINNYSHFLKSTGELLWILRAVLIAAVILHIVAAVQLTQLNRAARPVGYVNRDPQVSTFASRTMRWGGALLLLFIVLHILHFTIGTVNPARVPTTTDVYGNIVGSFRIWWVALFYVVSMIALGLHLFHGAWSSLRSLGLRQPSENPLQRKVTLVVALLIWGGFTIVPVAVFIGLIG
ncbi:MAG TPA: succinate dehydrogenase cytochrome b subunit [Gemmatimonadaceae bacterium]|nr:succinate dehydrogenase cytochrome b subunit [Gemmatimonadaceae bacterium]